MGCELKQTCTILRYPRNAPHLRGELRDHMEGGERERERDRCTHVLGVHLLKEMEINENNAESDN